jgi:putative phosphoesterase
VRIGIVSDSHDNVPLIDAAVAAFRDKGAEVLIHAGDFVAPFAVKRFLKLGVPIIAVFGNCDGEHKVIGELLPDAGSGARRETLGGRSVIVVHSLEWLGEDEHADADVIVCGHTHKPELSGYGPIVINPGECGGWVTGRCTAAFLDTETMEPELFELR